MKIKCLFLTALLLAVTVVGFAQTKKPTAQTTAIAPEQTVKDLYAAAKNEKTSPFFQSKNRALVNKYFEKELADMIWNDAVAAKGEIGAIDFDPLYGSQDPKITNLVVSTAKEDSGPDDVFVKATFKDNGKNGSAGFSLRREANKAWKIYDIGYDNGDELAYILRYSTDAEYKKGYDASSFQGSYTIGAMQCFVSPTMSRFEFYRVTCDGQEGFKLYAVDGNEKETAYIETDDKGKQQGRFVFKKGEKDGKFFDAAGKEVKVIRTPADPTSEIPATPSSESENESVSGELWVGKIESGILYVGKDTGDYAAYCFTNASEAGRAILAKCKDKDRCEVTATLGDDGGSCKVPGLDATLSADFRIVKVASAKSLGRRK